LTVVLIHSNDAEAHRMIAEGGNAGDVFQRKVAQPLHLGQAYPPERLEPARDEIEEPSRWDLII